MDIVFKQGKIPGYSLSVSPSDPDRMEVVLHFNNGMIYYTNHTFEELGSAVTPRTSSTSQPVGNIFVPEQKGSISEDGLLSLVALINSSSSIPR